MKLIRPDAFVDVDVDRFDAVEQIARLACDDVRDARRRTAVDQRGQARLLKGFALRERKSHAVDPVVVLVGERRHVEIIRTYLECGVHHAHVEIRRQAVDDQLAAFRGRDDVLDFARVDLDGLRLRERLLELFGGTRVVVGTDDLFDGQLFLCPFCDGASLGSRAHDHDLAHC